MIAHLLGNHLSLDIIAKNRDVKMFDGLLLTNLRISALFQERLKVYLSHIQQLLYQM